MFLSRSAYVGLNKAFGLYTCNGEFYWSDCGLRDAITLTFTSLHLCTTVTALVSLVNNTFRFPDRHIAKSPVFWYLLIVCIIVVFLSRSLLCLEVNGPPLAYFDANDYAVSRLKSGHHSALDRPTGKPSTAPALEIRHKLFCWNLKLIIEINHRCFDRLLLGLICD